MAMLTTHILLGIIISLLLTINPLYFIIGSFFPDIDIFLEHRKTSHRIFIYFILSIITGISYIVTLNNIIGIIFAFSISSFSHCLLDYFGSGDELKPWKKSNSKSRSLYNHYTNSWIISKRYYYDGDIKDFLMSSIFFILILIYINTLILLVFSTILYLISIFYSIYRKKLSEKFDKGKNYSETFVNILRRSINLKLI